MVFHRTRQAVVPVLISSSYAVWEKARHFGHNPCMHQRGFESKMWPYCMCTITPLRYTIPISTYPEIQGSNKYITLIHFQSSAMVMLQRDYWRLPLSWHAPCLNYAWSCLQESPHAVLYQPWEAVHMIKTISSTVAGWQVECLREYRCSPCHGWLYI